MYILSDMSNARKLVVTSIVHGSTYPPDFSHTLTLFLECHQVSITRIKQLSQRSTDYYITTTPQIGVNQLKSALDIFECEYNIKDKVDLIVQQDDTHRKHKKLVVFDMDSTLIYQEVIDMIAAYAGVEKQVASITQRAMNNEMDFAQSLRERVALLKGINLSSLYDEIKAKLTIKEGVPEFIKGLRALGCKTAVISGGFTPFALYIKDLLSLDYAKANFLASQTNDQNQPVSTGFTEGEIVDADCKARTLLSLSKQLGIPIQATMMVGDGANDLPAMNAAGFGIAWNAKPAVQRAAPCKLNTHSLKDAFYIMGFTDQEIASLLK